jgi:hypothetical protein
MGPNDKHIEEIEAYKENLIGDLTINDALILVAVCAAKEKATPDDNHIDDAKRIAALAQNHPIFLDLGDSIEPSINKFMNMIGTTTDLVKAVDTAANVLKPELKEIAFNWVAEIIMSDGVLTEQRKNILDKYALLFNIDSNDAQRILVEISNQ